MRVRPSWLMGSSSSSSLGALFRSSSHPGDSTNRFIDGCTCNVRNLRAASVAPKCVKALALDLAAKQGANAGAGKSEPNPINEVAAGIKVSPSM